MTGVGIGRRAAAQRIALHALAPLAALAWPAVAAGERRRAIAPPVGDFRLERALTRGLGGGAEIVVTRHWRIAFAKTDAGVAVSGEQIHAAVIAPPRLATLAEIERTRSTAALFPLLLDAAGLIRAYGGQGNGGQDDVALTRAIESGRALMASLTRTGVESEDARSFLAKLASMSAGAVSRPPQDLFFPQPGSDTATRDLALPDGGTGSITVTSLSRAALTTGLLELAERRIVTRVAGSERITLEIWRLAQV